MIEVENDGPEIRATNYWSSEHARRGFMFLSWNAKTARLLVPAAHEAAIADMASAECALMTRGPWAQAQGRIGWEILFEDHSDSPFAIHMLPEQMDRLIPPSDVGRRITLTVWTEAGKRITMPAHLRSANAIPYMRPLATGGRA